MRVIFTCLGNINRSVAAEAYLRHRRPDLDVTSLASTDNTKGQSISRGMVRALKARGIPVSARRKVLTVSDSQSLVWCLTSCIFDLHKAGISDPHLTGDHAGALDEIIKYVDARFPAVPKHWGDLLDQRETK